LQDLTNPVPQRPGIMLQGRRDYSGMQAPDVPDNA
jgi:hypothetical protein